MKSKASSFSVSLPLIIENLKRLWAIPALGFLVYFFSGPFPVIMSYKNINFMAGYIEMSLHNLQPFYMMVHLFLPVSAAVMLFRYLQSAGSTAVMHSMPFTRGNLFASNYLTGLILTTLPILANGLILLLISKPAYYQWGYATSMDTSAVDVFTKMEVVNWMGTSLLIVAVLYSIAVFAAIVTGNSIMHFLASYYFIFLVPLLYAVFNVYFQEYLFGFDLSGSWIERALSISPYTGILQGRGYFSAHEVLFYFGTIALMTVAGAWLYSRRKLERATDALTFEFVKPVISYVVAFLGMTMLGFYFQVMGQGDRYMYAGFVAGSLIFFIIGTMVVEKSPRIFNRKGLRNFLIYSAVAVIFVTSLRLDLTGFENRVPEADSVEWAEFYFPVDRLSYDGKYIEDGNLHDPENIAALASFHRSIVSDKQYFKGELAGLKTSMFRLTYQSTSRFPMSRQYRIDYESYRDSPDLKTIFESAEYKESRSFFHSSVEKYVEIYVHSDHVRDRGFNGEYADVNEPISDQKTIDELMALLEKDYRAMTYEELVSLKPSVASIELQFDYAKDVHQDWASSSRGYQYFALPASFANTLAWLEERGYVETLTADRVQWIEINQPKQIDYDDKEKMTAVVGDRPMLKITDKDQIQKVLDHYDGEPINYDTAYEIIIAYDNEQGYAHGYLNDGLNFLN